MSEPVVKTYASRKTLYATWVKVVHRTVAVDEDGERVKYDLLYAIALIKRKGQLEEYKVAVARPAERIPKYENHVAGYVTVTVWEEYGFGWKLADMREYPKQARMPATAALMFLRAIERRLERVRDRSPGVAGIARRIKLMAEKWAKVGRAVPRLRVLYIVDDDGIWW